MALRKIIKIDEDKCNGCGLCVPNCAEGAIKIIDGKAKLIGDNLCDGLGACLGHCPQGALQLQGALQGALQVIERDAEEFDEEAVEQHIGIGQQPPVQIRQNIQEPVQHGGCPGSRAMEINRQDTKAAAASVSDGDIELRIKPQLTQWPVQLSLVPQKAQYFENADLLITADCVPIAYPNYHLDLLKGKKVVIGCPKLDDLDSYTDKLIGIIRDNNINSITVAYMEVPCCSGMVTAAGTAMERSGKKLPLHRIRIGIDGEAVKGI